jgi:GNAT superfamily N-acetyltransferase
MATAHPAWRGSGAGWTPDPAATFVVIYEAGTPVAGGALSPASARDGPARASQVCVAPDRRGAYLGAALLDTLEALARGQGAARLRLDSSAFLLGDELPLTRCGYAIEPAYAVGADVEVWAAKELLQPSDLD